MESNFADAIGAVSRQVIDREFEGKPARVAVMERTYPAPIDDVWDALTTRERIPRWFLPITGDLEPGGRYQLEGNAGGEVLTCKPPRHLAVTWEFGGATSWVDVHLEEVGDETRLLLEHTAHIDPDDPFVKQFGTGAIGIGWDGTLLGLAQHLASPDDDSWRAAAEDLHQSPDGLAFLRASGEAWIEADIAYGVPEADARARGATTIAMYTGEGGEHPDHPGEPEDPGATA